MLGLVSQKLMVSEDVRSFAGPFMILAGLVFLILSFVATPRAGCMNSPGINSCGPPDFRIRLAFATTSGVVIAAGIYLMATRHEKNTNAASLGSRATQQSNAGDYDQTRPSLAP